MHSFEEIPFSLQKTEKRPVSQLQTKSHAKRKADTIAQKLKKTKRVHEQHTHWNELEKKGLKTDLTHFLTVDNCVFMLFFVFPRVLGFSGKWWSGNLFFCWFSQFFLGFS